MKWKLWLYGLITAVITGAASAASSVYVTPIVITGVTLRQLMILTAFNAITAGVGGMLAYLKTHPVPDWDGADRRGNGNAQAAAGGK